MCYCPKSLRRRDIQRRGGVGWPRELALQFTHPLTLLWAAALLSFIVGSITVGVAVVLIIVLNALSTQPPPAHHQGHQPT